MLVGKEAFAVYGALAEGPHCGLYVCQLGVTVCGELPWHEPSREQLPSKSEDYAMLCAQYMEETRMSIACNCVWRASMA